MTPLSQAEKLARRMADEVGEAYDTHSVAAVQAAFPYAALLVECEARMAAIEKYEQPEVCYDQFAYERLQENYREAVRPWLTKLRALMEEGK